MADLDTNKIPRDRLLGLTQSTLDEVPPPSADSAPYGSEPGDLVVRFTPHSTIGGVRLVERSHWLVALSATTLIVIIIAIAILKA